MRKLTVTNALQLFLFDKKSQGMADKTMRDYKVSSERFIRDMELDDTPIEQITKGVVTQWIIQLQEVIPNSNSINKLIRDVRVFLYWCQNEFGLMKFNIKCMRSQEAMPRTYLEEDLRKILAPLPLKAPFVQQRTRTIIALIMSTGARASTVLDMRVGDINYSKHLLTYRHTKNKMAQMLPLSDGACKVLMQYQLLWLDGAKEDDYFFQTESGGGLALPTLEHQVKTFVEACGVKPLGVHAFRHSFARYFITAGGGTFDLQLFLGHSDITVTKKYVRLYGQDLNTSAVPLDNLLR